MSLAEKCDSALSITAMNDLINAVVTGIGNNQIIRLLTEKRLDRLLRLTLLSNFNAIDQRVSFERISAW